MAISIFHVGLPLDHESIPAEDRPELRARLAALRERMRGEGFGYEFVHCSPETGLNEFRRRLKTESCDGVLVGGGVVGNPELSYFLEQIIDAAHQEAPRAKIMFYNHATDVREIIGRWFPEV